MTLKIQYASDLHLEFPANREFLKLHPLQPVGDILVLAGDIIPFVTMDRHKDFFKQVGDQFEQVFWLPGNHEYYRFDAATKSGRILEQIATNVWLVNNVSVLQKGIKLIFTTLWSKINPANEWEIEKGMNDFRVIRFGQYRFSAQRYNNLHRESLSFIQQELQESNGVQKVVFTHHCPTFMNYPPQYKGSALNDAFAVELFDLIEPSNIAYWIYGHHHNNTQEFKIGQTTLLTNQLGYVQLNEHTFFKPNKFLSISSK